MAGIPSLKNLRRRLVAAFQGTRRSRRNAIGLPEPIPLDPKRGGVAIVAIVKDEERYIGEWLAFHMLVGASAFVIYDNGSSDRTVDILRGSKWADRITIVPWRNFDRAIRIQNAAYNHALANFGARYRWMAFIDVDEFIVPKRADDLNAALSDFGDIPALSLPWHMFGPSGHRTRPSGLVIESYLERAEFPPRPDVVSLLNFKTVVDPTKVRVAKTHHVELIDGGEVMWNDRKERFGYLERFDPRHASADAFQLNHYFTRSQEELRERLAKGRVSKEGSVTNIELLEQRLKDMERYAVRDETILRFVPKLKMLMSS
jgi:hypothetical protein